MSVSGEVEQAGRSYHHGDLRSALIESAAQLLEESGPEAISFRAIARANDVSQTAPYRHFKSKEELLATVAEQGFRRLAASQAATVTASKAGADCLLALGRDYVRFAIEKPQLYRLMFGAGVVTWMDQPHIAEVRHTAVLPVREALEDHLTRIGRFSPAALETAATSAFAIVHGMAMLRIDQFMSTPASVGDDADLELSSVLALYISGVNAL